MAKCTIYTFSGHQSNAISLMSSYYFYIWLYLAFMGLHYCMGISLIVVSGLLIAVASLVAGMQTSVIDVHGLSCSVACGIVLNQGSNSCPLHWKVDS